MQNKSNFCLRCLIALVLSMRLTACGSSESDCAQVTEIPQAECAALVALYNSTNGRNWAENTTWLITATPCDWVGVGCSGGHVTELVLSGNVISGDMLVGAIPPEIGDLSNLTYLDLEYNQLTTLPPEIRNLSYLNELDLKDNQLTSLPREIGNLTDLEALDLEGNQLTGLPPEIGNLSNLSELDLKTNQLTYLPRQIGKCPI